MEPMAIAERLQTEFPDEVLERYIYQGQTAVVIRPGRLRDILRWLRDTPEIRMNHLRSLCGVDNSRHRVDPNLMRFEVVYNLYSIEHRHALRVRVEVGARIRRERLRQGLTQEQLALACGVTRNVLIDVEHGRRGLLYERLVDIAEALVVPTGSLFGDT